MARETSVCGLRGGSTNIQIGKKEIMECVPGQKYLSPNPDPVTVSRYMAKGL